jgi:hypothetical protein
MLSSFFIGYYNEYSYAIELANKLYDFEIDNDANKKKFLKKKTKNMAISSF